MEWQTRLTGASTQDDPFAETEDSDMYIVEEDMEAEVARERLAKMASFISRIIEIMPDESVDDQEIAELCSYLVSTIRPSLGSCPVSSCLVSSTISKMMKIRQRLGSSSLGSMALWRSLRHYKCAKTGTVSLCCCVL